MADKSQKSSNTAKYVALAVLGVVIIAAVVLLLVFFGKSEAKAIMQMSTNPSVQVVLDQNDKVISEVALNADGEKMLANVSFLGLKAEVAAQKFAQTATEMDKMNGSITSTPEAGKSNEVQITISAEVSGDYTKLAENAKKAVNDFFKENGIFAGATVSVDTDIEGALAEMQANAKEYAKMTKQEMLNFAKETSNELKEVAISQREEISNKFDTLYDTMLQSYAQALEAAQKAVNEAKDNLEKAPEETKKFMQQMLDAAQKALDDAKDNYNKNKAEVEKQFKEFMKTAKEKAKATLEQIKTDAKAVYEQTLQEYKNFVDEFKNLTKEQQAERQNAIVNFQASLSVGA